MYVEITLVYSRAVMQHITTYFYFHFAFNHYSTVYILCTCPIMISYITNCCSALLIYNIVLLILLAQCLVTSIWIPQNAILVYYRN